MEKEKENEHSFSNKNGIYQGLTGFKNLSGLKKNSFRDRGRF